MCYQGIGQFNPLKIHYVFSPLTLDIQADGEGKDMGIKVQHAAEDDFHAKVEHKILGLLGAGDGVRDVENEVTNVKGGMFKFDFWSECPAPWSSDPTFCSLYMPANERSCISVRALKRSGRGQQFTVEASAPFRTSLLIRGLIGLLLLLLSNQLSKSKIFQYSSGACISMVLGAMIAVLYMGRKKGSKAVLGSLALGYSAAVVSFMKHYLAKLVAAYWEGVLGYLLLMAAIGLMLTRNLRRNEDRKHTLRVCVKWIVRLVGVVAVYTSTYSSVTQAIYFVVLLVFYIKYAVSKQKAANASKRQGKKKGTKKA
ncbi:unnamed protein product [Chrysoparadoxa australica]